jgi:hypothetical protein
MSTTPNDTGLPVSRHSAVHLFAAWLVCLVGLGLATVAAFRTVEACARPAFERQMAKTESTASVGLAADEAIARVGAFLWPIELADGVVIRQEFDVHRDGLSGIRLRTVTWHETPAAHPIRWSLQEVSGSQWQERTVVRSGTLDPTRADDWGYVELRFDPIPATAGGRYALKLVAADGRPAHVMGLPLFEALEANEPPVVRHRSADGSSDDGPAAHGSAGIRPIPATAALDVRLLHAPGGD